MSERVIFDLVGYQHRHGGLSDFLDFINVPYGF